MPGLERSELRNLFSREALLLCYAALALTCIHYFGRHQFFGISSLSNYIYSAPFSELKRLGWWAMINLLFYAIIPIGIIRLYWQKPLSEFGFIKSKSGSSGIYLLFFLVMIPLVFLVSFHPSFQHKYPYYGLENGERLWPGFIVWEFLYFFQFVALEFFFRGFLIHGLKPKLGLLSIPVMTVPYCMIHFTKPLPETIGSVVAGLALGYLSYKKNSIWPGAFLHFGVALSMDLLSLWQKGLP